MISSKYPWEEAEEFLRSIGISSLALGKAEFRSDLEAYLHLLLRKNEQVNLTSLRDPLVAFWKHLVDSLTLLRFEPLGNLVDWGSGGGLPGIPLALARRAAGEEGTVSFLDSVGKKVRAIEEFGHFLRLDSSRYFLGRGEALINEGSLRGIHTVVMRAVAPPERAVPWLHNKIGRWVFLLGPQQLELWRSFEKQISKRGFAFARLETFSLPHGHGDRVLLELVRK